MNLEFSLRYIVNIKIATFFPMNFEMRFHFVWMLLKKALQSLCPW